MKTLVLLVIIFCSSLIFAQSSGVEIGQKFEPEIHKVSLDSVYSIFSSYLKSGATNFDVIYQPVKADAIFLHTDTLSIEKLKKAKPKAGDRIIIAHFDIDRKGKRKPVGRDLFLVIQ